MHRVLLAIVLLAASGCSAESEQAARYRATMQTYCDEAAATLKRVESLHSQPEINAQLVKMDEAWTRVPDPPEGLAQLQERARRVQQDLAVLMIDLETADLRNTYFPTQAAKDRKKLGGRAAEVRKNVEQIRVDAGRR
jgi:hypothetical protein